MCLNPAMSHKNHISLCNLFGIIDIVYYSKIRIIFVTTVAHADGVMASDSRFTFDGSGHQVDGLVSKIGIFEDENIFYGMAGRADFMAKCHDYAIAVQAINLAHLKLIFDQTPIHGKDKEVTFELLVHANGVCHKFAFVQNLGFYAISTDNYQTAGSGGEYAIEFLTTSSSDTVKAVEYAIANDQYSGGDIMATKEHHENEVLAPFMIKAGDEAKQHQQLEAKVQQLHASGYQGMAYAAIGSYSECDVSELTKSDNVTFGSYDTVAAAQFLDTYISA